MNKEIMMRINEALNYLRLGNRGHLNCIRLVNSNLRTKHTEEIISRCLEYLENGIPFVTEAIFKNNSRCDILLPATFEIEEIMNTETDESILAKQNKYPDIFRVIKVRV